MPAHPRHHWTACGLITAVLIGTWSTVVHCGGLDFPGMDTVAGGRGGAFVAKADTPSAFVYNPAGLAKAQEKTLFASIQLAHLNLEFQRQGHGGYWLDGPGQTASATCPDTAICISDPALDHSGPSASPFSPMSINALGPLPLMVFNWGKVGGIDGLAISAGVTTPSSMGRFAYPSNGPQRYSLVDASHLIVFPGVGIAWRINRYLQIGGVFMVGVARLNQTLKIRPLPSMHNMSRNENVGGDATIELNARDFFIPTGVLGILSAPVDALELGLSVTLPAMVSAAGHMNYTAPSNDMADSYMNDTENQVGIVHRFPLKIQTGIRYLTDVFDIEFDVAFENTASIDHIDIDTTAVISDPITDHTVTRTPLPDTRIEKQFRNTWGVRLGSDIHVAPRKVTVRLGALYQSSAYPDNNTTFNIDFPYGEHIGLSGGATVYLSPTFFLHASYMHLFQKNITVTRGIIQQQGLPLTTGEQIGNTVNNGTYQVAMNIFGLAGEYRF